MENLKIHRNLYSNLAEEKLAIQFSITNVRAVLVSMPQLRIMQNGHDTEISFPVLSYEIKICQPS